MAVYGKNVNIEADKKTMTIKIDLTKSFGSSKSGKSTIIASTEGNISIGDVQIGLNVYKKN